MFRFAANLTMMFNELDLADRFGAAARAGFSAVELLFPYEMPVDRIAELLDRHRLTLALFNIGPGDWQAGERGLAALPARRADFARALDLALSYAVPLGVKRLHMMAGLADPADPEALATFRENLALAADKALPHDISILIEPINRRDIPGYFLSDFDLAETILRQSGKPNAGLQFDIYHRQIIAGDVMAGLDRLIDLIGHVQIASVPGRNEPGSGELDDFAVFRHLKTLGYQGYIGCEYRPRAGTVDGLGWLEWLE